MAKRILNGSEAVALGALRAGVKVVTGYPGTPSTGCLTHLLSLDLPGRHVEWSTNEKVAFEIAAGAAWAGQRALVTMKMSGVNVAYDALISIAYSGTNGGLVIYVADDPGVTAGMAEQDSRGFARMADLPMLEPANAAEAYELTQGAFDLSEAVGTPVFLRLTTATALTHSVIECSSLNELRAAPPVRQALLEKDIARYTKAGSAICRRQHADLIERLERARVWIHRKGLNRVRLKEISGGLGIVACGGVTAYVTEAVTEAEARGFRVGDISTLYVTTSVPFPRKEAEALLERCETILVLEELEPYFERDLIVLAHEMGFEGRIIGKLDGTLPRIGEYGLAEIAKGLAACGMSLVERENAPQATGYALHAAEQLAAARPINVCAGAGRPHPAEDLTGEPPAAVLSSADLAAPRPITVCAGCPHRGTYLAIEAAIQVAGFGKDDVMVTGDIGCTILGMNPPFDLLWNEVSMGSSLGIAQGYAHAGLKTPVIATIGDSTFFHGGISGLINAIQHRVPLTLVVMDNGWTAMTGMQINPGTDEQQQAGGRRVDLEAVIRGLGPDRVTVVDPYDLVATTDAITESLKDTDGVDVVIARRECAIQASRRRISYGIVTVDPEKCILCKQCLRITGCPALSLPSAATELGSKPHGSGFDSSGELMGESAGARTDLQEAQQPGESSIVDDSPTPASIEIDAGACNGCGICVSFCPTSAIKKEAT